MNTKGHDMTDQFSAHDMATAASEGFRAGQGSIQTVADGRWYMVTQDGAATLCVDRADAEAEARKADREWPRNGPHRAVRLVESPQFGDFFRLKGQRRVLCDLLRECLPIIDAMLQTPGDDASDAHLQGLHGRVQDALVAVAEERLHECMA